MPAEPLKPEVAGFYGKLPARGDFVSRRLPRSFVEPWDEWLQQGLISSRDHLGEAWLDVYLTSPVWHFVLAPGVCGSTGFVGVIMPSVDGAGRFFPLTIAQSYGRGRTPVSAMRTARAWFADAERLVLGALADDFDLEAFDAAVAALPPNAPADSKPVTNESSHRPSPPAPGCGWQLHGDTETAFATLAQMAAAHFVGGERAGGSFCLWSAAASDLIPPAFLMTQGLPHGPGFTALLDGDWQRHGWVGETGMLAALSGDRNQA